MKRSLLVEPAGGPLAVVVSRTNTPDTKLRTATLDAVAVPRPSLALSPPGPRHQATSRC